MEADQNPGLRGVADRFTRDGDDGLELHVAAVCREVVADATRLVLAAKLEAILLGGGYGRGEGGVLKTPAGDRPYNDLEFYIFLRGHPFVNQRKYGRAFHELGERLSPEAGVEVEFKLTSREHVARSAPSMFFYDLISGHRRLLGELGIWAGCEHHRDAARIPLSEATRLLMNRCSGLLFARERLQRDPFTAEEADFVGRNHAKAQLAFGDVVLVSQQQYHWSCLERQSRMGQLPVLVPWQREVALLHAEAVEFKLHPQRRTLPLEEFKEKQEQLTTLALKVWLWLESQRLQRQFTSDLDYALSPVNKCPETNPGRNRLVNARRFGAAALLDKRASRYPRERLLNALTLLLWEPQAAVDPLLVRKIQAELNTEVTSFCDLVFAYRDLWQHFN